MIASWKESYDKPGQCAEKQDTTLLKKVHIVKAMVFPVVTYSCENWTIKKAEKQKKIECLSVFTSIEIQGGASGKESAPQCRIYKRCRFNPWVRKISWSRKWQSILVFLPGKSHGQRSRACYSPSGSKKSDTTVCMWTHTHTHTHTEKWFVSWKDIAYYYETITGFSVGSNSKESICNVGDSSSVLTFTWRMEDPLEKGMATHSSFLLGELHRQRSLAGYSPWSHRVGQNWATNTFMKLL